MRRNVDMRGKKEMGRKIKVEKNMKDSEKKMKRIESTTSSKKGRKETIKTKKRS